VLGVDSAGAGADRDDRVVGRVLVGEEELELLGRQLPRDRRPLPFEIRREVGVVETLELDKLAGATLETVPARDFVTECGRLPPEAGGSLRIVPDAGLG
jgi:hypothetical protein